MELIYAAVMAGCGIMLSIQGKGINSCDPIIIVPMFNRPKQADFFNSRTS